MTTFEQFSELPQYLKYEVLIKSSIQDFPNLCRINKEISEICSGNLSESTKSLYGDQITEILYRDRSEKYFDDEVINFKEPDMSWRKFYNRILKFYEKLDKLRNTENLPILLPPRNISIVNTPNGGTIVNFSQIIFPPTNYKEYLVNVYLSEGKLMELKLCKLLLNILPHGIYVKNIIPANKYNNTIEILNWLKNNQVTIYNFLNNSITLSTDIKLLEWYLDQGFIPEQRDVESAIQFNRFDILNIFAKMGIIPDQQAANLPMID